MFAAGTISPYFDTAQENATATPKWARSKWLKQTAKFQEITIVLHTVAGNAQEQPSNEREFDNQ